eukprot:6986163-Lingulodinium_polyedra.AAC.1
MVTRPFLVQHSCSETVLCGGRLAVCRHGALLNALGATSPGHALLACAWGGDDRRFGVATM